jgi:hypothetical protein
MGNGLEAVDRLATDLSGRAVGGVELGVFPLEAFEPGEEAIKLEVGNARGRVDVIEPIVMADFGPEGFDLVKNGLGHGETPNECRKRSSYRDECKRRLSPWLSAESNGDECGR